MQTQRTAVKYAALRRLACAVAAALALLACDSEYGSNGDGGPITPTRPLLPKVLSVSIVTAPGTMVIDERFQLVASVSTVDGALTVVGWSSSNTAVATVTNGGVVQAVSIGTSTVTATSLVDTSKSASVAITVGVRPAVNSVSITPSSAVIAVSATQALTANVFAVGGANTAVTWATSDASIATVSTTGVVTGVAEGTANITARSVFDATRSTTIPVIVVPRPP